MKVLKDNYTGKLEVECENPACNSVLEIEFEDLRIKGNKETKMFGEYYYVICSVCKDITYINGRNLPESWRNKVHDQTKHC